MQAVVSALQHLVAMLAEVCIPLVQLCGILILVNSAIKSAIGYVQRKEKVGAGLAHGLALGLEFLLGAEILHIVLADELEELWVLGVGIVIHVLLTMLLHWEVREGEKK